MDIVHLFENYVITIGDHTIMIAEDDAKWVLVCLAIGLPLFIILIVLLVKLIKGIIKGIIKLTSFTANKVVKPTLEEEKRKREEEKKWKDEWDEWDSD